MNQGITWGEVYWPIALSIAGVGLALLFFPAEFYALFTNHSNTLSDFARTQLDLRTALGQRTHLHTLAWWSTLVAWLAIGLPMFVWLTGHIWFDTWG